LGPKSPVTLAYCEFDEALDLTSSIDLELRDNSIQAVDIHNVSVIIPCSASTNMMMRAVKVCPKAGVGRSPEYKIPCFRANFRKSGFGTEES